MSNLILELRKEIVDSKIKLSDVLRKARVLAAKLRYEEFEKWIDNELEGYQGNIPQYRWILQPRNYGTFIDCYGRTNGNQPISTDSLHPSLKMFTDEMRINQSVPGLEAHLATGEKKFMVHWNAEDIKLFTKLHCNNDVICKYAWQEMSHADIEQILGSVRNRLLKFILELEKRYPNAKTEAAISSIPQEQIAGVFNYYILGDKNTVITHNPQPQLKPNSESTRKNNPWRSGSFYVFMGVIVLTTVGVIGYKLPWQALPFVVIASILTMTIIGAFQLKNDAQLKDANFIKLMFEVLKNIPILSQVWKSKQIESIAEKKETPPTPPTNKTE